MQDLFPRKLIGPIIVMGLLACTPTARAGDATRSYELMAADGDRTILIDLHLDGSLDNDFPPPRVAGTFDVASLDTTPDKNAFKGELLHVEIGKSSGLILKHTLGDVGVTVRLARPMAGDMDVERLNREETAWLQNIYPPVKKHPYDLGVVHYGVVSVNDRRFSLVTLADATSQRFIDDYRVQLTPDCDVWIRFDYVTNDYGRNAETVAWAHSLIGQIVNSLKVKVIENKP